MLQPQKKIAKTVNTDAGSSPQMGPNTSISPKAENAAPIATYMNHLDRRVLCAARAADVVALMGKAPLPIKTLNSLEAQQTEVNGLQKHWVEPRQGLPVFVDHDYNAFERRPSLVGFCFDALDLGQAYVEAH